MSITDAVNLVLYAIENGNDGDIFVKKAKAVRLIDLVYYFEKKLNTKVKVEVTNVYPGEKLHESLIAHDETDFAIDEVDFFRIPKQRKRIKSIINFSLSNKIIMTELELCDLLDNNLEINQMLK